MRKFHIFSALFLLTAWSSNFTSAGPSTAGRFQIGSAANAEVRWTPNPERGSASTTMSGGRRGTPFAACALDDDVPDPAITLLVPDGGVNLTTEAHPTLSWYLESDGVVDMEFMLSHPEQAEPVYTKEMQSAAGLVEVTLPESVALEVGKAYRWTVFVHCEGGEYTIHARSFVERTAENTLGEAATLSPIDRANAFAAQGIWYDALNTLVASYRQEGNMATLLEIRDLLRQADTEVPLELSLAIES
ncbi:MAG: DUF928 domain-containing protein [Cyanobacteria bacterium P01_C01_bin.121]